ncbi:hypothetical protein ACFOU2_02060 [Bacillus songklensis]|uniref:Uncharacterized protein n=1 Tax=Bacillus songklensis TaxID=1069116 RepID=A0ABV8AZI9_9BACI
MIETKMIREQYKDDYIELQKQWRKHSKELFLVGKLVYWAYWVSKYAEKCKDVEERQHLFSLKNKAMLLLAKSKHTQIRKYVPEVNKKLCRQHYKIMKSKHRNICWFLDAYKQDLLECESCQMGEEQYYNLYSLAIIDNLEKEKKKLLYIFYNPYLLLSEQFPVLEELKSVKHFNGKEYGTIRASGKGTVDLDLEDGFSVKLIVKKFNQNYEELREYFSA